MAMDATAALPQLMEHSRLRQIESSMCHGKRGYSSYREAKQVAHRTLPHGGSGSINVYACPFCAEGWYHIGHSCKGVDYEKLRKRIVATMAVIRMLDIEIASMPQ